MKKAVMIPIAAIVLGAALLLSNGEVHAQSMINPPQKLVSQIAQRFNLKQEDVQAVFDSHRQEMQQFAQAKLEEKLAQAVKDGLLTEDQKQLILDKHKELAEKRQASVHEWQNMTEEQRKATMQTQRQELQDWAKQNHIDVQYLFPQMGMRFGRHVQL